MMEFPAFMPKELDVYTRGFNEDLLLAALIKNPKDLVLFFETVSDDETWCENHESFMRQLLDWLTEQVFYDRLPKADYLRISRAIQKHYLVFKSYLTKNILIQLKDGEVAFNGLLLVASSDFFKHILLAESKEKKNVLHFPQLSVSEFAPIESFICTGFVPDLSTKGQEEIILLIRRAKAWELTSLSMLCEHTLPKYLTVENVFAMLRLAKEEQWVYFEGACIDFINKQGWGFKLSTISLERLSFEFHDFYERTIKFFEDLRSVITDIVCSGNLVEQLPFGMILKTVPDLFGLNISRTSTYSHQFECIPQGLQMLDVSECPWISRDSLKLIVDLCPNIKQLFLRSNVHLDYMFWPEFIRFKQLKTLNISNCTQLQDPDLTLIFKSLSALNDLSMGNCKKFGEKGFLEMAKTLPRLIHLDVSRTSLSDTALVEIGSRCRMLAFLNVSGCEQLTEKGILALIKHSISLQRLDLSFCHISPKTSEEIKRMFPQLTVVD